MQGVTTRLHGLRFGARPRAGFGSALAAALLLALAALSLMSSSASAAVGHSVQRTFSVGPGSAPRSIATDAAGNVYVYSAERHRILKFSSTGTPVAFSAGAPYVKGNAITGTPAGPIENPNYLGTGLAVDRSGGPNDGDIYLTNISSVAGSALVFAPSGAYRGALPGPNSYYCSAAVDQASGRVYLGEGNQSTVLRYEVPAGDPGAATMTGALSLYSVYPCSLAVDSAGAAYAGYSEVKKYDASQFGASASTPSREYPGQVGALAIDPLDQSLFVDSGSQVSEYDAAGALQGSPFGALDGSLGVAVAGDVFALDANGGVFVFGPSQVQLPVATTGGSSAVQQNSAAVEGSVDPDGAGGISACEFRYGPDSGYAEGPAPCTPGGPIAAPTAVTAALSGLTAGTTYHYRVFATNANGTQAGPDRTFTTPVAVEGVTTAAATGVTKDGAFLHGSYVGDGQDTHYYFEYGTDTEYGQTAPAPPGPDAGSASGAQEVPPIQVGGLKGNTTYHFRLVASNSYGSTRGQDETFTTAEPVTGLTTDPPSAVTDSSAELEGSYDADGYDTSYYFEWGTTTAYGTTVPVPPGTDLGTGSGRVSVPPVPISGLQGGVTYHYRIVASNENGRSVGADYVFKTAEPPQIGHLDTHDVTATSAVLSADVNPRFGQTTYRFEWGATTSYGNSVPVPDGDVGSGDADVPVSERLEGLTPEVTYHFRVVAQNQYGTTYSGDQSFGFYPPICPNSQVRQETGSSGLPDCRAYELVTPPDLAGTTIFPLNAPSSAYAVNPSRVAFGGSFGTLPDTGSPPNGIADLYASTRTDTGWTTRYIGRPSNEAVFMGRPPEGTIGTVTQGQGPSVSQYGVQASPKLDRFIDYELGQPSSGFGQVGHPSNAPYVWDASGNPLGRWPTNLAATPGGEDFVGTVKASADFSHFVFSSNVPFDPAGEAFPNKISCCSQPQIQVPMCCSAPIYDNDIQTGAVRLISLKEDGTPFRGAPVQISRDGSRILMSETADVFAGLDRPLFMRVNGTTTYEIAPGHSVHYVGSTDDGRTVYLTSAEQLTADDHDGSIDLFAWRESDPDSLTRVSFGTGGAGNSDDCPNSWIGGCGVKVTTFRSFYGPQEGGTGQEAGNTLSDSPIAGESGDIYFESPEQLIPGRGEAGQVNIYVYRAGEVRFVATTNTAPVCSENPNLGQVCSEGPISRMEVTPNGSHVAFITGGRLTAYDNAGYGEMYLYTAATGRVTCVSCRTDGVAPQSNAFGSQNGIFLADNGRAFFSTNDPLVAQDTNKANDVYEYVEGKAQLISSGLGTGLLGYHGFTGTQNSPGLVGVSANGSDVYFATFDVLVTQDHNGLEVKIYDARAGGGFAAERVRPNCAAADECHGPGTTAMALPPDRTSARTGKPAKKHPHRKHKKHRRAKKKHRGGSKKNHKAGKRGTGGRNQRG